MRDRVVPPAESRIEIACRGGVWVVTVHGEHDIATRPSLQEELDRVCAAGGRIVVDLSPASFLDSSVIRAVATPAAGHGTPPRVAGVVAPEGTFARRLAGLVGLDAVVPVHDTLDEALGGGSRR
jgi:anti-sigma B factor antagonist